MPNPYQTAGSGSGLADNSDATSAALDAERVAVTLLGLDAGTGLLKGEFVDLSSLNSSSLPDVDANEGDRQYFYDRSDDRFEQVVIYHAIDSIQRHFHALGFDDDAGTPNGIRDFPTWPMPTGFLMIRATTRLPTTPYTSATAALTTARTPTSSRTSTVTPCSTTRTPPGAAARWARWERASETTWR